ncbi:Spc98 family-domain-containing protein [Abortiporus biennis]|nr:Spc98 family-domain-containing protein [Abortiporus biennis]
MNRTRHDDTIISIISDIPPLPPLSPEEGLGSPRHYVLPDNGWSNYQVPPLKDAPENPIIDTLNRLQLNDKPKIPLGFNDRPVYDDESFQQPHPPIPLDVSLVWEIMHEMNRPINPRSKLESWDQLRWPVPLPITPSPFLSEQSLESLSACREHVLPSHLEGPSNIKHLSSSTLLHFLELILSGVSSPLYIWHSDSERFQLSTKGSLHISGKDRFTSTSVLERFITIGTLTRRLETLIDRFRGEDLNPTFYAFLHALETVLLYTAESVEGNLLNQPLAGDEKADLLVGLWTLFEEMEATTTELSLLCGVDISRTPAEYIELPSSASGILSHLYNHLEGKIDQSSPRHITAPLSFILQSTSQIYFRHLCSSVGFGSHTSKTITAGGGTSHEAQSAFFSEYIDNTEVNQTFYEDQKDKETFPSFIPKDLAQGIERAQKSLGLLRAADPSHPVLCVQHDQGPLVWKWTDEDTPSHSSHLFSLLAPPKGPTEQETQPQYKPELKTLAEFDMLPGDHRQSSTQTSSFQTFLQTYPPSLPSRTPTLSDLTTETLSPLIQHISSLSGALVEVLLSPTSYFHLHSHLVLLRSHLLLTSHFFKARLEAALFSDKDPLVSHKDVMLPDSKGNKNKGSSLQTALGLSPNLSEAGTWPPGGAQLSFSLRTVIVDSLEQTYHHHEHDSESDTFSPGRMKILEEAEWRLGFAIRDLHVSGDAKWLNPKAIEALDFLYMEYQPPHPLDVVIDPTVLSKYHRIFAFNLRLLRVENVMRALFRMSRNPSEPLFKTISPYNATVQQFRFMAQSFITSLSSYIYDTAIGSNFDTFLTSLSPPDSTSPKDKFSDIFAIAEAHSDMLDDILTACLLRSGQKAVGDLLRSGIDISLEFGVLMSELRVGNIEEHQAGPLLEALFKKFRHRMTTLVSKI